MSVRSIPTITEPTVTDEWLVDALRCRINAMRSEAEILRLVTQQHDLPDDVVGACSEMVSSLHRMDSQLSRLEERVYAFHGDAAVRNAQSIAHAR